MLCERRRILCSESFSSPSFELSLINLVFEYLSAMVVLETELELSDVLRGV